MGQPTPTHEMTDTQFRTALLTVLTRIAAALENQRGQEDDQTITMPLSDYQSFDWSSIGARVLNSDEAGPTQVWHDGKVYTRRTNDKFGQDIWFSRGNGRNDDGTPRYHKLIEFRTIKPAEPVGRKTEQALKMSQSAAVPPVKPPAAPQPAQPALEQARDKLAATVATLKHTGDNSAGATALIAAARSAYNSTDVATILAACDAIQHHIAAHAVTA